MSYTPPTPHEVAVMRAQTRIDKWTRIAAFASTASISEWATRMANRARADLQRLQEERS